MRKIVFFNNKGGVGKTSLVYHLASMFSELGIGTLAIDLDPQANLTSMFLDEAQLEALWPEGDHPGTVFGAIRPILRGIGDIVAPEPVRIANKLKLIPGDLGLSQFEDKLSLAWPHCHNRDEAAFRAMTAFHRIIEHAAGDWAELALIDVGPNLGAINRAALIAADHVVIPLAPDLFSLQGLRNLGPTLREWRVSWSDLLQKAPTGLSVPQGQMLPAGYVVMQHSQHDSRPVKAYGRWMNRIPEVYLRFVLGDESSPVPTLESDAHNLSMLKHYQSLMPLAMDAHKPMFKLKPADGAIGAHTYAVSSCYTDFRYLAKKIAQASSFIPKNSVL